MKEQKITTKGNKGTTSLAAVSFAPHIPTELEDQCRADITGTLTF